MRPIRGICCAVLTACVLALAACSGTTSASIPSPTATQPHVATPTTPPGPTMAYLGVGSTVYALDARTGSQRWKYHTDQPDVFGIIVSVFADAGTVFFTDYSDKSLYALDAATGSLRWKFQGNGQAFPTSVVVVSGIVYATIGDGPASTPGMYAIDLLSGALLWQTATGGTMAVTAGAVYLANQYARPGDPTLRAYNRLTGALLWQVKDRPFSTLQVGEGVIYTTERGVLYAYNAHTGAALWTKSFTTSFDGGSILNIQSQLVGRTMYVSDAAKVVALDVTTQQVLWQFAIGPGYFVIGDTTACVANRGNLYGLNLATGAQLWSMQKADGFNSLTYGSGVCYANTDSTDRAPLSAIDATTGRVRWSQDVKYIYGFNPLQLTADAIYFLSSDVGDRECSAQRCPSHLTALSTTDGSTLWTSALSPQLEGTFVLG